MSIENFLKDVVTGNERNAYSRLKDWWDNSVAPNIEDEIALAKTFFSAAIKAGAKELGADGLKIVTAAVAAAEQPGQTGLQKLQAATASIENNLSLAGIKNVAAQTINAAIEGAVAQMNASALVTTPAMP